MQLSRLRYQLRRFRRWNLRLLQRLVAETQIHQPALVVAPEPAGLETLLRLLLSGHLALVQQPRQGSFRRDWNAVVCFSCGKAGHSATRCPTFDDTFPFMPPGSVVRFDPRTPGNSSLSPVVGPQPVPSRISVVMVEERLC